MPGGAVGSLAATFTRALSAHWQAAAHLAAARTGAAQAPPAVPPSVALRALVDQLAHGGDALVAGWLGEDLTGGTGGPLGTLSTVDGPVPVRLGEARVRGAGAFPALVPLLGGAHLALNTDARTPRVAALLRSLVTRLLAACPAGALRVLALDQAALGATFLPLRPLVDAGLVTPPAGTPDAVRLVLDAAEAHVHAAQAGTGDGTWLLVVAASVPDSRAELARLAALTHAGAAARVCLLAAGWPDPSPGLEPPVLGGTTRVRLDDGWAWLGDPPGTPFSAAGRGLAAPVALDPDPDPAVVARIGREWGERVRQDAALEFTDLIPAQLWTGSSVDGLRTVVGRTGRAPAELAFDDATPHWLVGGRTGAGKTVFLLDTLYGLAARYSPDELALYLLDFKEGISFTEFTPTRRDPSFIPHARAVGVESDREYGVAVLRELRRELNRRAGALKRYGVTKLSELRRGEADVAMPRVVAVIDEFQVLFERSDALARQASALLEELARKGRSYGIHLVLASQTVAGVEALYGKADAIFGQFPLRVALPGGAAVLEALNNAADALHLGSAVVNPAGGIAAANTTIRFPDAHADRDAVAAVRHRLWQQRTPGTQAPEVFEGYATRQVEDDPTFRGLRPGGRRPLALVGRVVDVNQTTAYFALDATPGRHLATVGTSAVGADVLHAAVLSLAGQHAAGTARFVLAPLVAAADEVADEAVRALAAGGHPVSTVDAAGLRAELAALTGTGAGTAPAGHTYLVVFGVDAAGAVLSTRDDETFRTGLDDLQAVLRNGPATGTHLLGWWRGLRRLSDDIGGTGNRDDVSCLVALNVPGADLALYLGQHDVSYEPRPNRALLVDRHDQRTSLVVPFVRPGRVVEEA